MKNKRLAVLIAAVAIGTMAGGTAIYYANDNSTQLQIAGQDNEDTDDADADAADAADENTDAAEAGNTSTLPSGDIAKTDLVTDTDSSTAVADVAENVMPALVSITNTSVQEVLDYFRRGVYQYESQSAGTGVIMGENDEELLIVTNNHVVEDATELTVSFINEDSVEATVKGTDPDNDLAVVAVSLSDIDEDTLSQIRIARIADSDEMRVGEQVVAIGNALGYGQSVTTGIVSALNRTIQVQENYEVYEYDDLIQTDAAINPGNSGGALLNMQGEVIGINSAKASESGVEGMGYAIPTSKALPIIQKLMNKVTREKVDAADAAYIGISGEGVTTQVTQLYGMPSGLYVTMVSEGSPADEAGITVGMIITEFDDNAITSLSDLKELLEYYSAGETVDVTVAVASAGGEYEEQTLQITLGSKNEAM